LKAAIRLPLVALLALVGYGCGAPDRIEFANAEGGAEIGALLDGRLNDVAVNDRVFVTSNDVIEPGELKPGPHDEVVAFQQGRRVVVNTAPWLDGQDDRTIMFREEIPLRVQFWLLAAPASDRRAQVAAAADALRAIWGRERMGLSVGEVQITDRTAEAAGQPFLDFTCAAAATMVRQIGHTDGWLNFYYVDRVDFGSGFSSGNGVTCSIDVIAMGGNASPALSAHEAGHTFTLAHIDDLPGFDQTNVMHSASDVRNYLTEGQIFRTHLEPLSFINRYALRPGEVTRQCPALIVDPTDACPAIQKRIWADGTFPPN
jgi:hypothetical protein